LKKGLGANSGVSYGGSIMDLSETKRGMFGWMKERPKGAFLYAYQNRTTQGRGSAAKLQDQRAKKNK